MLIGQFRQNCPFGYGQINLEGGRLDVILFSGVKICKSLQPLETRHIVCYMVRIGDLMETLVTEAKLNTVVDYPGMVDVKDDHRVLPV